MMNIIKLTSIFVLVLTLLLGIIVLAHKPKEKINRIFFLIALAFSLWIFTNLMVDISSTSENILFWARLTIIGPFWGSTLFVSFSSLFLKKNEKNEKKERAVFIFLLLVTIVSSCFVLTKYNIESIVINASKKTDFQLGILYSILVPLLVVSMSYSLCILFKKLKYLEHKEKVQIGLIIAGTIISILVGTMTNAVLLWFGINSFTEIGPIFSVFFIFFTAIAIIRYSAFNISIAATEFFVLIILVFLSLSMMTTKTLAEFTAILFVFSSVLILSYFLIRSILIESERKKQIQDLANRLEFANKELKRLGELKDDFIHIAVHEINTPMASILGYLSMILDEKIAKIDKKAEGYLQKVYISSQRLSCIVTNFLDIIKLEGGKIKLNKSPTNLRELINEVISEYEENARKKNNTLTLEKSNMGEIIINIDRDKIKESIINLVDNAIKFTENGLIKIIISMDNNDVHIYIKDSGRGMSSNQLEKIFEKFYQVESEDTNQECGSGLGLYIAKMIIEMHGGTISAESILNGGTKFDILLPIEKV